MPRVTPIHWRKFERFLVSVGCILVRERGDHRMYDKPGITRVVVIQKKVDLSVPIIKNNLKTLGISTKEYLKAIEKL